MTRSIKFKLKLIYCARPSVKLYILFFGKLLQTHKKNPKLNSNYTTEQSNLPDSMHLPAQTAPNPFFKSIPAFEHNELVLNYQHQFVDKLLETSLPYNHILY